jgi:hypothetical protein
MKSEFGELKRLMLQVLASGSKGVQKPNDIPSLPLNCPAHLDQLENWLEIPDNFQILVRDYKDTCEGQLLVLHTPLF